MVGEGREDAPGKGARHLCGGFGKLPGLFFASRPFVSSRIGHRIWGPPVIPYLELPELPFGLRPFGVLFTLSVIVGHLVFVRRARGPHAPLGAPAEVEALAIGAALSSFAGAYGVGLLVASGGALSSAGGLLGALLGLVVLTRLFRLSLVRAADVAAYAFPFGWFFARAGCAFAHDHLGKPSTSLFSIRN